MPDAGRPVWIIANPTAGGGRGGRHAAIAARVLAERGLSVRLLQPSSAEEATVQAHTAGAQQASAVIAAGGDGTVHAVLQGVAGTASPLGIVAAGSGDDIAASLGFPLGDPQAAGHALADALATDSTCQVDAARVTAADGVDRWYLGVMSTGFDSSVNERANRMHRMGGQRYTAAMLRELASFRALPYRVEVDGQVLEDTGMLVSVGNGPRFGGGMLVCPAARLDDGLLDVTWLGEISKPRFLGVFPSVYRGEHVAHPAVRTLRARALVIDAPGQVAYADGERIGPLPVRVQAVAGAVRVLGGGPAPRP